ncbi:MAG: hypothetical protein ACXVBO_16675 [Isosphaeraceae bacterium]
MLVRFTGSLEQPAGLGRVAVLPEGDQGLGIRPVRCLLVILLEEPGQFLVPFFGQ